VPGPQHKYTINREQVEKRTPMLSLMAKGTGRYRSPAELRAKPKKDNSVGPATYRPEAGFLK
jgi:hypothetical protein